MDEMKEKIRQCCLEKEPAPCVSACPFGLDVREFVPRVERGAFNLAYRLYATAVAFPRIVSEICGERCKSVCPRRDSGGAVDLKLLEKAAVRYASRRAPNNYNLPPKNEKIAVIGAGISGLACALRLASKKYDVTVYEKEEKIGGHLWERLPSEIFLKDIEEQFANEKYSLRTGEEVSSLEALQKEYDAVYIATGKGGAAFGLFCGAEGLENIKEVAASREKGIFAGGSITGVSSVEAIAHGLSAAALIEAYIKTGNMKEAAPRAATKIELNLDGVTAAAAVLPSLDASYTEDEARREAARCLRCRCDSCVRACDMMEYFQKFPKLIEEEVHITVFPGTLDGNGTVATRLISTCNQCGLCEKVCPQEINVGLFLRESHRAMREKNAMPWAFHEFWLNDMAFSRGADAKFFHAPASGASRYLFFPGCQMGASDPAYVTESYRLIKKHLPDTAILVDCCGAPALWAGDQAVYDEICSDFHEKWESLGRPVVIFGCPTCMKMTREKMPDIEGKMISDLFYELGVKVPQCHEGGLISVFDPCAARDFKETQANVRKMLTEAGFELAPLAYEKDRAKCCSWGGQISIANPPYAKWLTERRVSDSEQPYVVYCTNCRDLFAEAGKPVKHILDVFIGAKDWERRAPSYSKRRRNRELVKEILMKELLNKEEPAKERPALFMSQETEEKLNREKILDDDIIEVINFCERTGRKLEDEGGHSVGYREIGHMTCWVEYTPREDGYFVHNAYSHRMKIELEEVWDGRKHETDL
ncbi:MAG: FAD-dependent oxidoreductase [Cloacibacillus sp.]